MKLHCHIHKITFFSFRESSKEQQHTSTNYQNCHFALDNSMSVGTLIVCKIDFTWTQMKSITKTRIHMILRRFFLMFSSLCSLRFFITCFKLAFTLQIQTKITWKLSYTSNKSLFPFLSKMHYLPFEAKTGPLSELPTLTYLII